MVVPQHEEAWPDKAMFAGVLLTLAGLMGSLFSILLFTDVTFGRDLPGLFSPDGGWPAWIMLPASLIAFALGILSVRHHSALFLYIGAVFGIVSLAGIGLIPLLSIIAIGFMVKAHVEGEDTTLATPTPATEDWPDKALAASILLFVTGIILLFQAGLTYAGRFDPLALDGTPWVWATISLLVGAYILWAAREVYQLRRAWSGTLAGILGVLSMGLYIVGPLLSIAALVLLVLADKEQEFLTPAAET